MTSQSGLALQGGVIIATAPKIVKLNANEPRNKRALSFTVLWQYRQVRRKYDEDKFIVADDAYFSISDVSSEDLTMTTYMYHLPRFTSKTYSSQRATINQIFA